MTTEDLQIEYMNIKDINPAKYNPRDISETAFQGLRESIRKFGMVDPLIINVRYNDNTLCGGHQRLKAAIAEAYETVPVVKVDLSRSEEKALNLTLNNKNIAGFFTEGVNDVLKELQEEYGDNYLKELQLDSLYIDNSWESDIESIDKVKGNLDGIPSLIKITCKPDDKDAVLFYLKEKLMETSFEGVHIE